MISRSSFVAAPAAVLLAAACSSEAARPQTSTEAIGTTATPLETERPLPR